MYGRQLAILIGCDYYKDLAHLTFAEKDSHDFMRALRKYWGFAKGKDEIIVMSHDSMDEYAASDGTKISLSVSRDNVNALIRCVAEKNGRQRYDRVVVGFWGHGKMNRDATRLYLCVPETTVDDLAGTSISFETLCDQLDGISTDELVFFLDCCRATGCGGGAASTNLLSASCDQALTRDPRSSRPDLGFDPPLRSIIISGCSEGEVAQEDFRNQGGLFTNRFNEVLRTSAERGGSVTFVDIIEQTKKLMNETSYLETQTPFIKIEPRGAAPYIEFKEGIGSVRSRLSLEKSSDASDARRRPSSESNETDSNRKTREKPKTPLQTAKYFLKERKYAEASAAAQTAISNGEDVEEARMYKEQADRFLAGKRTIDKQIITVKQKISECKFDDAADVLEKIKTSPFIERSDVRIGKLQELYDERIKYVRLRDRENRAYECFQNEDYDETLRIVEEIKKEEPNNDFADRIEQAAQQGKTRKISRLEQEMQKAFDNYQELGRARRTDDADAELYRAREIADKIRKLDPENAKVRELFSSDKKGGGLKFSKTVKGVSFLFRKCNKGWFYMGADSADFPDETPRRRVVFTRSFYILETPVTRKMWKKVMEVERAPSGIAEIARSSDSTYDEFPVENVSWFECRDFIAKLNQDPPKGGWVFDFPTEAQWEYACRAGSTSPFFWGNTLNGDNANCNGTRPYGINERGLYLRRTSPVRKYKQNDWGIYDMHGNVAEWCWDYYGPYRDVLTEVDPTGPSEGSEHVVRGGDWFSPARNCRSSARDKANPKTKDSAIGFRVVIVRVN